MKNSKKAENAFDDLKASTSDRDGIAALAYQLWQERGCPIGSADEDWFRAEKELTAQGETVATAAAQ